MSSPTDHVEAGQAVYNPLTLKFYDTVVLGFSNRLLWRCPTALLKDLYNRNVSEEHLDIGVGTGYFLHNATWPVANPQITLVDLNPHSLRSAAHRIARYAPKTVAADVFKPLPLSKTYKSIGLCYLLHCLPGAMSSKAPIVFNNAQNALQQGGTVFGATIVQGDSERTRPAQSLMNFYNKKGIFSNDSDTRQDLERALHSRFANVTTHQHGTVVIFEASN